MYITCLDMEGVLVPEIWVAVAEKTGIEGLKLTTKDEPDYDKLMKYRLNILREHGLTIHDIQEVIETMEPMEGAKPFLDELRQHCQVIVLSDTFEEFAMPLLKKLNYPTIFCNTLVIDEDGYITDYKMRCTPSKLTTVKCLQNMGFETICSGDSYNDVGMITNSKAGFFFKSTKKIQSEYPEVRAIEEYDELLEAILAELK